ncbi:PAS domain-containing sensor histidine kinase [Marinifilum sp. RC60d5]|uniref:PAS domain-containing sensor histidine kinase n=1 Tax=Marinifilum sp. RC60d5 TaxID=3458414 RepID=UPI0040355271
MEEQDLEKFANSKLDVLRKLNLSSIFENTSDSVWAINSHYEILFANKIFISAFYSSFGIELKLGTNLLLSLPEPIREVWKLRYDKALNNESFSFIDKVNIGLESLYIEVFMNPIILDKKLIGALFFGKDITERKLDELALKNSQLLLKASLESQKDTILFSIDKNYEYLYFNSAHAKVMKYAYDKEIEIGSNILECMSSENDRLVAKENFDRALLGESHSNIRVYGDENKAYYESFFNPIRNDENKIIGTTGLARDVSHRKKTELALLERERELKELNTTKDKLFSIIGHDLCNPFNNILGFSDLLIENLNDPSFNEHEKYLKIINDSANNTLILLQNLLDWAKSQTGMLSVREEKLILSDIILEVIELKKPNAKAKNISINYYLAKEIKISTDKNLLKTILRNLISNAIKYTEPEGEIQISAIQKKEWIELTVSDNGIGISKEKQHKLFKLSLESSTIGTANEKGSGFGLLLCKDFIKKLNGKLWVESIEGKGSDFKFTLPLGKLLK